MLQIGLTGGIGSGKSTVAQLFKGHGIPVIDTDAIARELVKPGLPAYKKIIESFGQDILSADHEIDRKSLGNRVFTDPQARRDLESILHPLIRQEMSLRLNKLDTPYCVIEIPLLAETGQSDRLDRVLVVDAQEQDQIQRVMERNGFSEQQVRSILANQCSRSVRLQLADDVILNDKDLNHLEAQVEKLHHQYLVLAKSTQI